MILYPCEQTEFDFTQVLFGFRCFKVTASVAVQNTPWAITDLLPLLLAIPFIFTTIVHVLYRKRKMSRRLMKKQTWKRTRKMFLQLLPIAFIFLFFNMPLIIVGLLAISDSLYNTTPLFDTTCLSYGLPIFIPFAVMSRNVEIRNRLLTSLRL